MSPRPHRLSIFVLCLTLFGVVTITACTSNGSKSTTLSVLASSELADMQPLLDELRRNTGIRLKMDYQGTLDASKALMSGDHRYDLAWLSSDRYLRLKLKKSGDRAEKPLSTSIMLSPVVIGVKPGTAERLRKSTPDGQLTWADIADGAAAGSVRFGMADPKHANSGLAALVGVATAAAGTGGALRSADISCDRLRGFRSGQVLTADTTTELINKFTQRQDDVDALIGYESNLLSLNAGGRLREPLEIIYPKDGMVLSDYPLLLLDPAKRAAYDKVVSWLKSESTQRKIMERTLRRPLNTDVPRDPPLRHPLDNALYFPDQQEVVDKLLDNYGDPKLKNPDEVIFVLDFSGSMQGARISELRSAFGGLSGADGSTLGKFVRFYLGEKITVIRFGGRILDERNFTVNGQSDLDIVRDSVDSDAFDDSTAVWSALDHAYQTASDIVQDAPERPVSIVLMTDGENNTGISLDEFIRQYASRPSTIREVHTFPIRFGDADPGDLERVAQITGGHMIDATAGSLSDAFKEIRGCR